uniref:Uncharacterized protein n=1 Tax=Oryzias latipes TaxID=8090 RepID=A0A3B3HTU3_ORYLA
MVAPTFIPGDHCNSSDLPAAPGPGGTMRGKDLVFSTTTSRATYDNAYFYIVFVMVFYSVLALTLFKCFAGSDEAKKDPHEEFTGSGQTSTQTFNAGHMAENPGLPLQN